MYEFVYTPQQSVRLLYLVEDKTKGNCGRDIFLTYLDPISIRICLRTCVYKLYQIPHILHILYHCHLDPLHISAWDFVISVCSVYVCICVWID